MNVQASSNDTVARVDRSVKPAYPDWFIRLAVSTQNLSGPAEYDLSKAELWLHEEQKNKGSAKGWDIYTDLRARGELGQFLGFADGLVIQGKGVELFRRLWGGNEILLWAATALVNYEDPKGTFVMAAVPTLVVDGNVVKVGCQLLDLNCGSKSPGLRFPS